MTKVSVIVPVYNVSKYIDKCIMSILNNTYKNIEIIAVDDGSSDDSLKKLKKYKESIKIYHKTNGGLSDARNFGLTKATGDFIFFVDSDDYIDKETIEKLINKQKEKDYDLVECNFYYAYNSKKLKLDNKLYNSKKEMLTKGRVVVCNKLFKRSIIEKHKIRFQKNVYYEDIGFTNKYILNSHKIGSIKDPLYYYVQRKESITGSRKAKGKLDILKVFDDLIKYYKDNNFYEKYYEELEYLVSRIILGSSLKRMSKIKDRKIRIEYILKTYEYLITNFPGYKNNKYIKEKCFKNFVFRHLNKRRLKLIGIIL